MIYGAILFILSVFLIVYFNPMTPFYIYYTVKDKIIPPVSYAYLHTKFGVFGVIIVLLLSILTGMLSNIVVMYDLNSIIQILIGLRMFLINIAGTDVFMLFTVGLLYSLVLEFLDNYLTKYFKMDTGPILMLNAILAFIILAIYGLTTRIFIEYAFDIITLDNNQIGKITIFHLLMFIAFVTRYSNPRNQVLLFTCFIIVFYHNLINYYTIISDNPLIIGTLFLSYIGYQVQSNYEENKIEKIIKRKLTSGRDFKFLDELQCVKVKKRYTTLSYFSSFLPFQSMSGQTEIIFSTEKKYNCKNYEDNKEKWRLVVNYYSKSFYDFVTKRIDEKYSSKLSPFDKNENECMNPILNTNANFEISEGSIKISIDSTDIRKVNTEIEKVDNAISEFKTDKN